ncbi:TPA: hypothetical protein I3789_004727, partial [Enterobacter cloacae]|nr:hypothetical protein [Enterobacter cloacae]
ITGSPSSRSVESMFFGAGETQCIAEALGISLEVAAVPAALGATLKSLLEAGQPVLVPCVKGPELKFAANTAGTHLILVRALDEETGVIGTVDNSQLIGLIKAAHAQRLFDLLGAEFDSGKRTLYDVLGDVYAEHFDTLGRLSLFHEQLFSEATHGAPYVLTARVRRDFRALPSVETVVANAIGRIESVSTAVERKAVLVGEAFRAAQGNEDRLTKTLRFLANQRSWARWLGTILMRSGFCQPADVNSLHHLADQAAQGWRDYFLRAAIGRRAAESVRVVEESEQRLIEFIRGRCAPMLSINNPDSEKFAV